MAVSSLRRVTWVMDWLRSISDSRLMPSGVTSNAQAISKAIGKPISNTTIRPFITQPGASMASTNDIAHLQQQPGRNAVGDAHTEHVATFQFFEQWQKLRSPGN